VMLEEEEGRSEGTANTGSLAIERASEISERERASKRMTETPKHRNRETGERDFSVGE